MVLRNVPSTATFEEQRVEINELAVDVDTLASNPDTLQTVTDRGFATTNPIRIENYAATAFVIEDNSNNEKFVVDSVNGKINVGSSAGGASGIYLFHNNSGATPAITLDGATGSITNKGQLVTESILSSAALNNKGSVQFGTVDAYSIGHMPLNSNLAFSQTHGGSYLFYSDASTVELEIASGGVKVDGILESSLLVNTNNTPTAGEGIEVFYDSAASGGAAGSIQAYDRDGTALTRLKIRSSNWEIDNDGSGTFGGDISIQDSSYLRVRLTGDNTSTAVQLGPDGTGSFASGAFTVSSSGALSINRTAGTNDILAGQLNGTVTTSIKANGSAQFGESGGNFVSVDTDGKLTARNSSSSATVVLAANFNGTDNFTVAANGTITSNSGLAAASVNLQSSSTASWFQTGTSLGGSDYVWAVKNSSTNTWHGGLKTSSDLYLGGDITSDPKILLNGSNGSASFDETVTIGSGSAAPDDYGLIAYANANTLSNKSAVYARNLADGRNFTGDNAAGTTTFELYASGQGNFGAASNSTGNNGVLVGGNNGTLNLYTDRYSTDCFQILNTSGSGTNIALKAYGNGNLEMAGTISDSKGDLRKIPFKQESNAYTLVAADAGKAIEAQGDITVPNGVFGSGDAVTIINDTGSDLTISMGSGLGSMFNVASGTSGNLTFGGRGMATIYFVNGTTCYISGSQLS